MANADRQNETAREEIEKLKSNHDKKHKELTAKIAGLLENLKDKGAAERALEEENEKIQEEVMQLQADLETGDVDLDLAIKKLETKEADFILFCF